MVNKHNAYYHHYSFTINLQGTPYHISIDSLGFYPSPWLEKKFKVILVRLLENAFAS